MKPVRVGVTRLATRTNWCPDEVPGSKLIVLVTGITVIRAGNVVVVVKSSIGVAGIVRTDVAMGTSVDRIEGNAAGRNADAAAVHGADLAGQIPAADAHVAESGYVYVAATSSPNGPGGDRHVVAGLEVDGTVRDNERPGTQEIDVGCAGGNGGVWPKDRRAGGHG